MDSFYITAMDGISERYVQYCSTPAHSRAQPAAQWQWCTIGTNLSIVAIQVLTQAVISMLSSLVPSSELASSSTGSLRLAAVGGPRAVVPHVSIFLLIPFDSSTWAMEGKIPWTTVLFPKYMGFFPGASSRTYKIIHLFCRLQLGVNNAIKQTWRCRLTASGRLSPGIKHTPNQRFSMVNRVWCNLMGKRMVRRKWVRVEICHKVRSLKKTILTRKKKITPVERVS
jgi:hypothetical protein